MTAAIVALSLVLLTGYAGEINLAVLSFGAIGAIIVHHYGVTGGGAAPGPRSGATCSRPACAPLSALVALPSLRLRGLYLALSTLAFGVFVSNMVLREITERKLPLLHTRSASSPAATSRAVPGRAARPGGHAHVPHGRDRAVRRARRGAGGAAPQQLRPPALR